MNLKKNSKGILKITIIMLYYSMCRVEMDGCHCHMSFIINLYNVYMSIKVAFLEGWLLSSQSKFKFVELFMMRNGQ